jgi:hypothetical protein
LTTNSKSFETSQIICKGPATDQRDSYVELPNCDAQSAPNLKKSEELNQFAKLLSDENKRKCHFNGWQSWLQNFL